MKSIRTLAAGLGLLAVLSLAVGCSGGGDTKGGDTKAGSDKGSLKEEHPTEGPHHGPLVEWGEEEYHAEFTVDHKTKTARVYILGPDAKKAAPIKVDKVTLTMTKPVAFQLELKPEKQKDDPEGTASVFVGSHDSLGKEAEFEGTLSAKVGDKPTYVNNFKVKDQDHSHKK